MATQNILRETQVQNATCPKDKLHKDYKDGGNLFLRVYRDDIELPEVDLSMIDKLSEFNPESKGAEI
ncbi:hypothetical protein OAQ60_02750 [Methylophilaceae bacterium]|nr:hypothetical protein [Methylophilaceae bacterium]